MRQTWFKFPCGARVYLRRLPAYRNRQRKGESLFYRWSQGPVTMRDWRGLCLDRTMRFAMGETPWGHSGQYVRLPGQILLFPMNAESCRQRLKTALKRLGYDIRKGYKCETCEPSWHF